MKIDKEIEFVKKQIKEYTKFWKMELDEYVIFTLKEMRAHEEEMYYSPYESIDIHDDVSDFLFDAEDDYYEMHDVCRREIKALERQLKHLKIIKARKIKTAISKIVIEEIPRPGKVYSSEEKPYDIFDWLADADPEDFLENEISWSDNGPAYGIEIEINIRE